MLPLNDAAANVHLNGNWAYLGPDLSLGPLPAIIYCALSAEESLTVHPYSQIPEFLKQYPVRVFSLTLPYHGNGLDPKQAIPKWAQKMKEDEHFLANFLSQTEQDILKLIEKGSILPEKTGLAGLSRGAFIATHLAARLPQIPFLLGYAPLTKLSFSKEFAEIKEKEHIRELDLIHLVPRLLQTQIRYYIGNHDTLVGTELCFELVKAIGEAAYEMRIRSPQVEMIIGHSIGHMGHGTSTESFQDGALWLLKRFGNIL